MSGHAEYAAHRAGENLAALADNANPGDGIVMGRTWNGNLVQLYWTVRQPGEHYGSKFREEESVISAHPRGFAFPSGTVRPPYNAMAQVRRARIDYHIASNGQQTDEIITALTTGGTIESALGNEELQSVAISVRPALVGIITSEGWDYMFWLTRHSGESRPPAHTRTIGIFALKGYGYCLQTKPNDGKPLSAYTNPYLVPIGEGLEDTAEMYWEALNTDNRVALATKQIDPHSREVSFYIHD